MKSHHRSWLLPLVIAIGAGIVGCQQEGDGARNVVQVFSVNDNEPLISDVYNFADPNVTGDDFIPIDVAEVTFVSRVHDGSLSTVRPGSPFGSVTFNSYSVEYQFAGNGQRVSSPTGHR